MSTPHETVTAVQVGTRVVGFIEPVGPVFVGLLGARYDRAVEITQKLVYEDAVAALLDSVPASARLLGSQDHGVPRKRRTTSTVLTSRLT